jgi:hypothetical protein
MISDKRGLSTIVITLIIILISLVAVGIVWVVVRGVIQGGTAQIDITAKCLGVDISATKVNCSTVGVTKICDVEFTRTGTGSDAIGGVKLVFRNTTAQTSPSGLITVSGNIDPLLSKTQTGIDTTLASVNNVQVTPFFTDGSGNDAICSQTNSFTF